MLILPTSNSVTVKRNIQSSNYVRIGMFETYLWVDGLRRSVRNNAMPCNEFTINDCIDLLGELECIEKYAP